MPRPILQAGILACLSFAASGARAEEPDSKPAELATFQTLDQGVFSGVEDREQLIVTDAKALEILWDRINRRPNPAPLPKVDFEHQVVVGVFLGAGSCLRNVEIARIERSGDDLTVFVRETRKELGPGEMAPAVVTSPFHLVVVDKPKGKISFRME